MRRPLPCFLTIRIHPVGHEEDSQAGTQPLAHPKEENAQPHGGREREVDGESPRVGRPLGPGGSDPTARGDGGCAGDHTPRSPGLFLGAEGCLEGQDPTLPSRHEGASKGLETPQLAGTCVPSKSKGGQPCDLGRMSNSGALAPSLDTCCGHHAHVAGGDGVQAAAGRSSSSHTDTRTSSRTRSRTPPGPRASSAGRTLVHVVQAGDLEHLAATALQLQPHGRDLRELASEQLGDVIAAAVPLGEQGTGEPPAAEPEGRLGTGTVPPEGPLASPTAAPAKGQTPVAALPWDGPGHRGPAYWSDVAQDVPSKVPFPCLRGAVAAMLENHVLSPGVCHHQTPVLDRLL